MSERYFGIARDLTTILVTDGAAITVLVVVDRDISLLGPDVCSVLWKDPDACQAHRDIQSNELE